MISTDNTLINRKEHRETDDEGEKWVVVTETWRVPCVYLDDENGAWLICLAGRLTDDSTPNELYSCASSLPKAKRVARQMAANIGYEPAFNWVQTSKTRWVLVAKYVEEQKYYAHYYDEARNSPAERTLP